MRQQKKRGSPLHAKGYAMADVYILDKNWVAKSKPLFYLVHILDKDSNLCFGLYRFLIRIGLLKANLCFGLYRNCIIS
jgi:hypothetical protein